ncbi:putative RNA-directed DNA polymerase from transposon X-element [Trichonephila clavipes]|nr:putative RNA-directed DNA polymerase from transposon X-element [Trichonephila clavipes]
MNEHLSVCAALQETLLKPSCTSNIRGYSILQKDCKTGERACGGVALLINHAIPFSLVLIRTSLQTVAVRVPIFSAVTIFNVYLPSNAPMNFRELQELIDQLPSSFILLGDFNSHHLLWGCQDVNSRGKVVKKLLTELDLTLLNDGSNTYFHSPTQSFSAIDLSICSPSLLLDLTWSVLGNPLGSDHFPVVISYATPIACVTLRQPRWKFDQADWETFRTQADITENMVSCGSIDEEVSLVTSCILCPANNAISQPSSRLPHFPKPWWNEECQMAKKDQNKAWNRFRRYPTPGNMIVFNKARARARKIHRQRKTESWIKYVSNITCSTSSKENDERSRKTNFRVDRRKRTYQPTTFNDTRAPQSCSTEIVTEHEVPAETLVSVVSESIVNIDEQSTTRTGEQRRAYKRQYVFSPNHRGDESYFDDSDAD